jgi:hypothetical protein
MLILNMFIYKSFYWGKKNLQGIVVIQMYEIVKIQMRFQSNYLICLLIFFIMCKSWKIKCHMFLESSHQEFQKL